MTYNPDAENQGAQHLFDGFTPERLPDLYAWLSRRNIDANVTPHSLILGLLDADAAGVGPAPGTQPDVYALAALGRAERVVAPVVEPPQRPWWRFF